MNNNSELSPEKKILRRMGYLHDQKGIINRYMRETDMWHMHLEKTKSVIKEFTHKRKAKKVAILGSGWLLDIPVDYLSEYCQEVHMYDIFHPAEIKYKNRKLCNIFFHEIDLTGGLIKIFYQAVKEYNKSKKKQIIEDLTEIKLKCLPEVDLIFSVNILDQLDILALRYLEQKNIYSEQELNEFRKFIQTAHIDFIKINKGILITDINELLYDYNDNLLETKPILHVPFEKNNIINKWVWKFDNHGTYYPDKKVYYEVVATEF